MVSKGTKVIKQLLTIMALFIFFHILFTWVWMNGYIEGLEYAADESNAEIKRLSRVVGERTSGDSADKERKDEQPIHEDKEDSVLQHSPA